MISSFEDNQRFQEIMSRKMMEEKRSGRAEFGSDDSEREDDPNALQPNVPYAGNDIYAKKVFTADLTNEHCRRWEQMFKRLCDFRNRNGHCLVPNRYAEDPQLGAWVATQRRLHKLKMTKPGDSTPLTDDRENRLVRIGFEWSAENPRCVPWETRFVQLLHFVVENGHAQVPIGWEQNVQLANWVSMQRQEYKSLKKGFSSRLTQDRIDLLNRVGFVWEAKRGGPKRMNVGKLVPNPDTKDGAVSPVASSCNRAAAETLLKVFDNGDDATSAKSDTARRSSEVASSPSDGHQEGNSNLDLKSPALQLLEAENDGRLAALAARGEIARLAEAGVLASARGGVAGGIPGLLGLGNSPDMTAAAAILAGRNANLLADAGVNSRLALLQQLQGNNALQEILNPGSTLQNPLSVLSSLGLANPPLNAFPSIGSSSIGSSSMGSSSLGGSSTVANLLSASAGNPLLQQNLSRLGDSVERALNPQPSSNLLTQALLRSSLGGAAGSALPQTSSQTNQELSDLLSQERNPFSQRRKRERDADSQDNSPFVAKKRHI